MRQFITDANGKPLVVYRGEHGDNDGIEEGAFIQSRLGSISFGSIESANIYAMTPNNLLDEIKAPRIIPAKLIIENPIVSDEHDPFIDFTILSEAIGEANATKAFIKYEDEIINTNNWEENFGKRYMSIKEMIDAEPDKLQSLYIDAYHLLDDPAIVEKLIAAGFDGAIHGGNGITAYETEYKVFNIDQIVSAYAITPTPEIEKAQNKMMTI